LTAPKRKQLIVITADIRGSKGLDQRARVQRALKRLVENLNTKFGKDLVAPFMITLGDEFQGVTRNPRAVLPIYLTIRNTLQTGFYCGVGVGGVLTPMSKRVVEMDGPAFHNSRDAVTTAKKRNRELVIRTGNHDADRVLNALASLTAALRNRWTRRQKQVVEMLEANGLSNVAVAIRLGISKQAVSKTIRRANYREVKEGDLALTGLLVNFMGLTIGGKPSEVD
jgi:hypothetical protein